MTAIQNRYEFVYLFDVENGNPNGDPDAGNMPRIDPETGYGLVTDVCLKRKVRNFVDIVKNNEPGFKIYIAEKAVLNQTNEMAYKALDLKPEKKKLPKKWEDARKVTRWMCDNFYDVRTFGAVMTTEVNCGQVRGPVQLTFARSIEEIVPAEVSITRMAVTNERDLEKERTMGRKHIIPYALYRAEGFISAHLADGDKGTGFSEADLNLLWQAMENMFDHDHSAARGKMNARRLIIFKHDSKLGNAPAHKLFDLVKVERATDPEKPPRSFSDYTIAIDQANIPQGVTLEQRL
ncbi:CRISPR-associated protein, Csd2 family [Desulfonatronospira thiodismutans ASO3-1]|uniref:CRISPR-associated protein, Csd2 family n=1 Tax=Desulfonatronospira thiodismutans ASO3-1 TaxID=555779 RepID=D6SQX7_9BACT|nr:type I-C CRISPR-associated protein Cas7/Csd2 [Desulfonatronospira thiodismutans]EFI35153.1 CRISPR-associated protein, Csd2 family [Desulfonatronospira thiodismutans ASO3-1]